MPQLTLVSHFYPSHRGGVEIVAGKLADELTAAHNFSIDWFASDCDPIPDSISNKIRCLPQPCWNGFEKRFGIPWPVWTPGSYLRLWRSIKSSDAVHVHDFIYLGSLMAILSAWLLRKPVFITQHVGWIPYRNPVARILLALVNRTAGAVALRFASRAIFISMHVNSYFSRFVAWKNEPLYIPNGTDTEIFHPITNSTRDQIKRELGVMEGQLMLLFVGRFVEKKGLHILEKIVSQTPDVYWSFCGTGELNPGTWQLPNLHVHEGLSGASLARLYQAADLLVLPSRGEGFPLVVQESMACGTPVLISTETAQGCPAAMPFIMQEPCDGDGDQSRWLARINALRHQSDTLQSMRPAVASFAHINWNWSHCAQQYNEILQPIKTR